LHNSYQQINTKTENMLSYSAKCKYMFWPSLGTKYSMSSTSGMQANY